MEVERLQAVLEATGIARFQANMEAADRVTSETKDKLGALAEVSRISTEALQQVKMKSSQAVESRATAERILDGVRGISEEAHRAARALDDVHLRESQAAETAVAADRIDRKLKDVTGNANEARRALESVKLASAVPGGGGGGFAGRGGLPGGGGDRGPVRTTGVGVGPFGSGFGRVGVLGAAIGAGVLTGPAAAPAALGLLAAIPTLAATGAGALGTLMLAFDGVGKAIGGDKKAFDDLTGSQKAFVLQVRSLDGWFDKLKETAANAAFPGLTKGLHEALSPQTVGAISTAVGEFGHSIGAAGEQWGKYFGSARFLQSFEPLMRSGAQDLRGMSGAALELFDSLLVLGRAAAPLTSWLVQQAQLGSRWLNTWLRAREATGGLARAMTEAQSSLALVGRLVQGLWHVVMALGTALYPVSRIAVKDLTVGLNALAGVITRNQSQIRALVGGALNAFVGVVRDLSRLIRVLSPALHTVFAQINQVAHAMGGWNHVIEVLIALKLASVLSNWAVGFGKVGAAAGPKGAAGEVATLTSRLKALRGLGVITVGLAIALNRKQFAAAVGNFVEKKTHSGFLGGIAKGFERGAIDIANPGLAGADIADALFGRHKGPKEGSGPGGLDGGLQAALSAAGKAALGRRRELGSRKTPTFALSLPQSIQRQLAAAQAGHGNVGKADAAAYGYFEQLLKRPGLTKTQQMAIYEAETPYAPIGGSPFGKQPAFTKNTGPKPTALDQVFSPKLQAQLEKARSSYDAAGTPQAAERFVETAKKLLDHLNAQHATGKKLVALERERKTIVTEIAGAYKKMAQLPAGLANRLATAKSNIAQGTLQQENQYLALARKALEYLRDQRKAGADLNAVLKERRLITEGIEKAEKRISVLHVTAQQERILGIGPGAVAGAASLREQTRKVLLHELEQLVKPTGPHVRGAAAANPLANLPAGALHASATQLVRLIERQGVHIPKSTVASLQKIQQVLDLSLKEHVKLNDDVRQNVSARLGQIRDTLKSLDKASGGNLRPVSVEKLLAGVAFASPAAKKEAEGRYAAALALGGREPVGPTALGAPLTPPGAHPAAATKVEFHGGIHVTVQGAGRDVDPKQIAREVRQEIDKHVARNGVQYRGRHPGR